MGGDGRAWIRCIVDRHYEKKRRRYKELVICSCSVCGHVEDYAYRFWWGVGFELHILNCRMASS